jgi:hypothetical protein
MHGDPINKQYKEHSEVQIAHSLSDHVDLRIHNKKVPREVGCRVNVISSTIKNTSWVVIWVPHVLELQLTNNI